MTGRLALVVAIVVAMPGLARAADLWSMNCRQLWIERNAIFKARGLCFVTADAVRTFGNDGCRIAEEKDVPLVAAERRMLAQIALVERSKFCK